MRLLIIFGFILCCTNAFGQNIKNIYAFKHINNVGTIPKFKGRPNADNPEDTASIIYKRTYTYYIFLEISNTKKPNITNVLYNNNKCSYNVVKLDTTPYVYTHFDGMKEQSITLIPKSKKNIYRLHIDVEPSNVALKGNELSVTYLASSKALITKAIKLFTLLPASIVP